MEYLHRVMQKMEDSLSWAAAVVSMGAALGWINIAVGMLTAAWLATQLYRFWRYEHHKLAKEEGLK
jgi:fatty acid desaturase